MELATQVLPTISEHAEKVVSGDIRGLIDDFESGRGAQMLGAVKVPAEGVSEATIEATEQTGSGEVTAWIRYTAGDASTFVLRSRWRARDGIWKAFEVRNLPEIAPRFGTQGPSADGLDEPYWDGLRAGKLVLQRCTECREWIWGPSPICPACHSFDVGWEPVDMIGTVYSWTRVWQPFSQEAAGHLPYVVVLVEIPHAGHRRVLGVLTPSDGRELAIGAEVYGMIEHPESNEDWPLLRWRLMRDHAADPQGSES